MKFQELIFDTLTEELKNKKVADVLMFKWNDEFKQLNPGVGDITKEEIDRVYDIFTNSRRTKTRFTSSRHFFISF